MRNDLRNVIILIGKYSYRGRGVLYISTKSYTHYLSRDLLLQWLRDELRNQLERRA